MTYCRIPVVVIAFVLISATGCDRGYKLAPVSGRVLIDKHPVAGVEVSFHPTNGKDMPHASGVTDAEGNYTLQTFVGNGTSDGAVIGENRVSFAMSKHTATKKTPAAAQRGGKEEITIPAKYRDSPPMFTVPPEGSSEANFELSSR